MKACWTWPWNPTLTLIKRSTWEISHILKKEHAHSKRKIFNTCTFKKFQHVYLREISTHVPSRIFQQVYLWEIFAHTKFSESFSTLHSCSLIAKFPEVDWSIDGTSNIDFVVSVFLSFFFFTTFAIRNYPLFIDIALSHAPHRLQEDIINILYHYMIYIKICMIH